MRNLEWFEGKPDLIEAGMILKSNSGLMVIVGHVDCLLSPVTGLPNKFDILSSTVGWAWLIQPYQLEWLEDMAKRHKAKGRGE